MGSLDLSALSLRLRQFLRRDGAIFGLPPLDGLVQPLPLALSLDGLRDVAAEAPGTDLGADLLGQLLWQGHGVLLGCHTIDHTVSVAATTPRGLPVQRGGSRSAVPLTGGTCHLSDKSSNKDSIVNDTIYGYENG